MIFYKNDGTRYDTTDFNTLDQLRKEHLLSALHFNESGNLLKDECGNKWESTENISIVTSPSVYKNTLYIPPNNNVKLKNSIEIKDNCFTIEFWMNCEKSTYSNIIEMITDGSYIELLCDEDLLATYTTTGSFKIYSNSNIKNNFLDIYNQDSNSLHHFAISYIQGNTEDKRIIIEWIDGFCRAYYTGIPELNIPKGLSIGIFNRSLDKNLYIAHLRVWSGLLLYDTTKSISDYFQNNTDSFYCDLQDLTVYSYMATNHIPNIDTISYTEFSFHASSNKYKRYPNIIGFNPKAIQYKEDIENSLVYIDFSDSTNLFKDKGSLGLTWTPSTENINVNYTADNISYNLSDEIQFSTPALKISASGITSIPDGYETTYVSGSINSNITNIDIPVNGFTIDYFLYIPFSFGGKENIEDENDFADIHFETFPINNVSFPHVNVSENPVHVAYVFNGTYIKIYIDGYMNNIFERQMFNDTTINTILGYLNIYTLNSVVLDSLSTPINFTAYIARFRLRKGVIYNKEFDPIEELFDYDNISTYLQSSTVYSKDILKLFEYPVKNPQTLYDTGKSCIDDKYVFISNIDSTKEIKFETEMFKPEDLPSGYKNYPVIRSNTNTNGFNMIKFKLNGYYRNRYKIEFYIYPKLNFSSVVDYVDAFIIEEKDIIIKIPFNTNGFLNINNTNNLSAQFYLSGSVVNMNQWNNFKIIRKEKSIILYINNRLYQSYDDNTGYTLEKQNISLHQIMIPTGHMSDSQMTFYYTGISISRI